VTVAANAAYGSVGSHGRFLRVALLSSGQTCRELVSHVLRELHGRDFCRLEHFIQLDGNAGAPSLPLRLYGRIERAIFGARGEAPDSDLRRHLPRKPVEMSHSEVLRCLASQKVDVVVLLEPGLEAGMIAAMPEQVFWSISYGPDGALDLSWGLFLATLSPPDVPIRVVLSRLTGPIADRRELACGTLRSQSLLWVSKNLPSVAHMAASLVVSTLWNIHVGSMRDELPEQLGAAVRLPRTQPAAGSALGRLAMALFRYIGHRIRRGGAPQRWSIALRAGNPTSGLLAATNPAGFIWMQAPPGRFYADPFLYRIGNSSFLFVEDIDSRTGKGSISCMEVKPDLTLGNPREVLVRPYHLSYPQVFEEGGEIYMIPESGSNFTVELYRAVEFPWRWELVKVLHRGPAFDVTMLREAGRFWFFVTLVDREYECSAQLVLFSSPTLAGDWTLHPASPISRDVRYSRGAGRPFREDGRWIRCAQDGTKTYGWAIQYLRIDRIDMDSYEETPVGSLSSHQFWGLSGTHTYNRSGDVEAVDGKRTAPAFRKN
jgi:hypothetical protein